MEGAESAARKYLARKPAKPLWSFRAFTMYVEVKAELSRYRNEYLAVGTDIVENLDRITADHIATCADAARQATGG